MSTRKELSIDEIEPTGVLSTVRFDNGRRWTMVYFDVRAALYDAVLLGMLDDARPYMEDYQAEPNAWSLFKVLPEHFEESHLKLRGWKLDKESHWVM